jgi:Protein of unknown function (DUF3145)
MSTPRRPRCARTSQSQPAEAGTYRTELSWQAPAGSAAALASAMRGWDRLRFEVTEEPTASSEGARFSFTPTLGIFHAMTGLHGDVLIPEDRIKAFRVKAALGEITMDEALDGLLGLGRRARAVPARRRGRPGPLAAPGRLTRGVQPIVTFADGDAVLLSSWNTRNSRSPGRDV